MAIFKNLIVATVLSVFTPALTFAGTLISDVTIESPAFYDGPALDLFFDGSQFVGEDLGLQNLVSFVTSGSSVDVTPGTTDLNVEDSSFALLVGGHALDFAFNLGLSSLDILFDVSAPDGTNTLSSFDLVVARLTGVQSVSGASVPITSGSTLSDLDATVAQFSLHGASLNPVTPIPLPAGIWLLLSGLGGAAIGLRRKQKR